MICVSYVCSIHVSELRDTSAFKSCASFTLPNRSEFDWVAQVSFFDPSKPREPLPYVNIREAFRGEKVTLSCAHTRRHSKIIWFLSKTSPDNPDALADGLIALPKNECFGQRFYEHEVFGVEALEVVAQPGTIGFITCAEDTGEASGKYAWIRRATYLILLHQPAKAVARVDFFALSTRSCEAAQEAISERNIALDNDNASLAFTLSETKCTGALQPWECIQISEEGSGHNWRRSIVRKFRTGFIPTGPLEPFVRLRFERVSVGAIFEFVSNQATLEARRGKEVFVGSRRIRLGQFTFTQDNLCVQARTGGRIFDWVILEPYLGYAELSGGIRLPFDEPLKPGAAKYVDGVQVRPESAELFKSVYLEQALSPDSVLERITKSNLAEPRMQHGRSQSEDCGAPVITYGQEYLTAAHPKLCKRHNTNFTITVTNAVAHLTRRSARAMVVKVVALLANQLGISFFYELRLIEKTIVSGSVKFKLLLLVQLTRKSLHLTDGKLSYDVDVAVTMPRPDEAKVIPSRLTMQFRDAATVVTIGFVLAGEQQLRGKEMTLSTAFNAGLDLITRVATASSCLDCFISVNVDRRGAHAPSPKWAEEAGRVTPIRPPINSRVTPLQGLRAVAHGDRWFKAVRSLKLTWQASESRPLEQVLEGLIERLRLRLRAKNVTVIFANFWPVCPPGHRLAVVKPPMCLPCPPGTRAVPYIINKAGTYAPATTKSDLDGPFAYLCDVCPRGTYQSEPGQLHCVSCSNNPAPVYCDDAVPAAPIGLSSHLGGSPSSSKPGSKPTLAMPHRTSLPSTAGLSTICLCLVGLLVGVVYFYLESIGFMLVGIARAPYSELSNVSAAWRRRQTRSQSEIRRLQEQHPEVDFGAVVRDGLCAAEIRRLRTEYPQVNWDEILCEAEVQKLRELYPFIRWDSILCEEAPQFLRARYPRIDWDRVIRDEVCEKEIRRLREDYTDVTWSEILCDGKIRHLRIKYPCLNWDQMVCEERIRRLKRAFPRVNFDSLIREEVSEAEIGRMKTMYPEVDWGSVISEEKVLWARARHPMVNWANIVSEEKVRRLKTLYPHIDWANVVRKQLHEDEVERLKARFSNQDWQRVLRGDDLKFRVSRKAAVHKLTSLNSNIAWEDIVTADLCDGEIQRLREEYAFLDWEAITETLSTPAAVASTSIAGQSASGNSLELLPCLELLFPCIDWSSIVEQKWCEKELKRLRSAYSCINWDHVLSDRVVQSVLRIDDDATPTDLEEGACPKRVSSTSLIVRLRTSYPPVNWPALLQDGLEETNVQRMQILHPHINWAAVFHGSTVKAMDCVEAGSGSQEETTGPPSDPISHLQGNYPFIDWGSILHGGLSEDGMTRIKHSFPYINWRYLESDEAFSRIIASEVSNLGPSDEQVVGCALKCDDSTLSTTPAFVSHLHSVYPGVHWSSFVPYNAGLGELTTLAPNFPFIDWDYLVEKELRRETAVSEIARLRREYPHVNWDRVIAKETRRHARHKERMRRDSEKARTVTVSDLPLQRPGEAIGALRNDKVRRRRLRDKPSRRERGDGTNEQTPSEH
ncbi:unnamed protein product [Mesocestoides corti]|uniref:Ephrin_rec_like domain-containing protein n=1 Tax=Mesocestoides corti TaxID=53468 RepID=A0A0R3U6Y3_MESCO|nr:unnamed protein product [Mesocestoides corti]